ncbi:hypothetical protein ACIQB4_21520 [Streptomyces griseoluteus]|uniref:hypothetical protein n=1 Tax=Streptomyces griseoluteus TaxID=29306 RepID=UPI003804275B
MSPRPCSPGPETAPYACWRTPPTGTLLPERLDERRPLSALPGTREAVDVLGALLARLTAHPAPPGLR